MCGRYAFFSPAEAISALFDLDDVLPVEPSYNLAPTDYVPVVRETQGDRRMSLMRWGLLPYWVKSPTAGVKMINARAETIAEKPAFRRAFQQRRCLLPASGFFEWQKTTAGKVPYFISLASGEPFAFAGLWESWGSGEEQIVSVTIVTTQPNELLSQIHDRMPVILPPESYSAWLCQDQADAVNLLPLLQPYPAGQMQAYSVTRTVNDVRNKGKAVLEPECYSLF